MATIDPNTLCNGGISYPVAIEIARQMTVGAPSGGVPDRLIASGIVPMQAAELANQINAGAFAAHKLCMAMLPPDVAKLIKTTSGL